MAKPQKKHTVKGISSKPYKGLNKTSVIDNITVIGERNVADARKGDDIITVKKGIYHTVKGGAGKDKITLKNVGWNGNNWNDWGDKDLAYGDAGNDKIYIMAGRHEVFGGSGNDTITIYAGAQESNFISGEAGNDSITVNGGNYHTIYAGGSTKKGYDTITIKNGTKTTVYGEGGVDKITVTGGREHIIYGGEGKDVINIGSTKVKAKPAIVTVYGGEDADKITVNKGDSHEIYTSAGNDTVTVNSGSGHIIANKDDKWNDGYGGKDVFTINKKAGNNIKVYGINSSNETVNVYGGSNHEISLGNGNNRVLIAGGKNHNVYTGDDRDIITVKNKAHVSNIRTNGGNDDITIEGGAYVNNNDNGYYNRSIQTGAGDDKVTFNKDAGSGTMVKTEDGDDKVYVKGGKNLNINAGDGKDLIEVTGGSSLAIDLESGENKVTVSAAKDVTISMNSQSDDRITLNWGTNRGLYKIYAKNNNSIATTDSLTINNAKASSFTFQIESESWYHKNLLLTSTNGSKILIDYWADNNSPTSAEGQTCFTGIKFADGWQSFATINKKAGWVQ